MRENKNKKNMLESLMMLFQNEGLIQHEKGKKCLLNLFRLLPIKTLEKIKDRFLAKNMQNLQQKLNLSYGR